MSSSNVSTGLFVNLSTGDIQSGHTQFRNRIINGDMRIAQRGTSTTTAGKTYLIDRFSTWTSITTGQLTTSQNTLTSSDLPYQFGFRYSNKLLVTTAVSSYLWVAPHQHIEGSHVSDLMWGTSYGSPVTLSFWLKTNATGQHSIAIRSGASGITNYNAILNISVANTWDYYTFNIPAPPSGTTWAVDYTNGIEVFICPLFGTSKTTGWTSIDTYIGVTGSVNWPATLNNYIEFTGVQFEKGTKATPFEFRPYSFELQLCQRYYQIIATSIAALADNSSSILSSAYIYIVPLRTNPTPTITAINFSQPTIFDILGVSSWVGVANTYFTVRSTNSASRSGMGLMGISGYVNAEL
jgi:hypothetical protein